MGEVDVWINVFLTSAVVGGEWSDSRPCRFNPKKGGWVDTRGDLDDMEVEILDSDYTTTVLSISYLQNGRNFFSCVRDVQKERNCSYETERMMQSRMKTTELKLKLHRLKRLGLWSSTCIGNWS
jgi:hypothetical protein